MWYDRIYDPSKGFRLGKHKCVLVIRAEDKINKALEVVAENPGARFYFLLEHPGQYLSHRLFNLRNVYCGLRCNDAESAKRAMQWLERLNGKGTFITAYGDQEGMTQGFNTMLFCTGFIVADEWPALREMLSRKDSAPPVYEWDEKDRLAAAL